MKTALLYIAPLDARETFRPFAQRWADSYRKFPPQVAHDIFICWSCGKPTAEDKRPFHGLRYRSMFYGEAGFDIGAAQHVASQLNYDLFIAQTSRVYYWRDGWLERIVEARQGDHVYGAAVSWERCPLSPLAAPSNNAHLRTVFYGMSCDLWRKYPYRIDNREKGFLFESGEWNYADYYRAIGRETYLVGFDGVFPRKEWRNATHGFRQGDQSNALVRDKHADLYTKATTAQKRVLERNAGK
jgi:hypothetical protein